MVDMLREEKKMISYKTLNQNIKRKKKNGRKNRKNIGNNREL